MSAWNATMLLLLPLSKFILSLWLMLTTQLKVLLFFQKNKIFIFSLMIIFAFIGNVISSKENQKDWAFIVGSYSFMIQNLKEDIIGKSMFNFLVFIMSTKIIRCFFSFYFQMWTNLERKTCPKNEQTLKKKRTRKNNKFRSHVNLWNIFANWDHYHPNYLHTTWQFTHICTVQCIYCTVRKHFSGVQEYCMIWLDVFIINAQSVFPSKLG